MVLPLSFLLLVFLTNDLDQPRATTSSFGRGARSDASCTVEEFPIQRQDPKLRCQEQLSVLVKEDHERPDMGSPLRWFKTKTKPRK